MRSMVVLCRPALVLLGACLVSGCSAFQADRNCGTGGCPGDAAIAAEVRRLLSQHPALEPPNLIDVQTSHGVVYLYGLLDTDLQKQLAEAVASQAPGVRRVVDGIGLRNGAF